MAHHVGDILTIVLSEQTAAQKSTVTATAKNTTDSLNMTLLRHNANIHQRSGCLNNAVDDTSKFDGEGNSAQSNSLTGYITVTESPKSLPTGNVFYQKSRKVDQASDPGSGGSSRLRQGVGYVQLT